MRLLFSLVGCATDDKPQTVDSSEVSQTDSSPENNGTDPLPSDSAIEIDENCIPFVGGGLPNGTEWTDEMGTVSVTIDVPESCSRRYSLWTYQDRIDNLPINPREIQEVTHQPVIRTGNEIFDALYALSIVEVSENSVDSIQDDAFNNGEPIECPAGGCFETGRKWPYVWTRDTAYASVLSLALLDPIRTRNSLAFKLSTRRNGSNLQIIQDTGTGGSYPVSTDRVVWSMGALSVLHALQEPDRSDFQSLAYEALKNTANHDRALVWDDEDGLYYGEMSFLDWREQSYPDFTAADPTQIAMSKTLSTNVAHLRLLEITASLAERQGLSEDASQYSNWAADLHAAIEEKFWLADQGHWSAYLPSPLDPAPTHRQDALGTALAVLAGLGTETMRSDSISNYPHLPKGLPVLWPQQQFTPIYHNRGIWPFVTAFWVKAAKSVGHADAVSHGIHSLVRAAALNLSNMENLEASTGLPYKGDEGEYSGPVVNSQRQLWSVAGYAGMVQSVLFGFEPTENGFVVNPFVTFRIRHELFGGTEQMAISRLPYHGGQVAIQLNLGPANGQVSGALIADSMTLNGTSVSLGEISASLLTGDDLIEVTMVAADTANASIIELSEEDLQNHQNLFGPRTPEITNITGGTNGLTLSLDRADEVPADIVIDIFRDGVMVANNVAGETATWTDPISDQSQTHCYSIQTRFLTGTTSQHSKANCWWGPDYSNIQNHNAQNFTANAGSLVYNHGAWHFENWGAANDTLTVHTVTAQHNGAHWLQLQYGNGSGPINTGVTCAVKRVTVYDDNQAVDSGVVFLPQLGTWDTWADSTLVPVDLEAGKTYQVVISQDTNTINMSEFDHFAEYSGTGGSGGPSNFVNITGLKLLRR